MRGEQFGELDHPLELLPITVLAPARVIQVLPAPGRVDAGGLEVAERVRAHPHVLPGRRDGQLADPGQVLGRLDAPPPVIYVAEAAAPADPAQARSRAVRAAQPAAAH